MPLPQRLKLLTPLVVAAALLAATHALIRQFTVPDDRLYQFIYARGVVQHMTLAVAALVIGLLVDRLGRCLAPRRPHGASQDGYPETSLVASEQLREIAETVQCHGAAAAVAQVQQLADEGRDRIRRAYEWINGLADFLPALGVVGTMLGISGALYDAFGRGLTNEAVQQFVSSLATAMDTTVLAMLCGAPLFAWAWLMSRHEIDWNDWQARCIRQRLGLEAAAAGDTNIEVLQAELRRVTRRLAAEARAAFAELLENAAAGFQDRLGQAVADVLGVQRQHNEELMDRLARGVSDRLGQGLQDVGSLLAENAGRLSEDMIRQFGRLEQALRDRTPEEVIVRYPHNGHVRPSRLHKPLVAGSDQAAVLPKREKRATSERPGA